MSELQKLPKKDPKPVKGGRLKSLDEDRMQLTGKRFIFTCAQNNTKLHEQFWKTLVRMSKVRRAQLIVSGCTYNKNGWQRLTRESSTLDGTSDSEGLWWDHRIAKHRIEEQARVADGLVFCGELDILPTAVTPTTGLDNYTGPNSAIIPHVKMQLRSLATMKHQPAKMLYTTGAVTLRNYIQRKTGQIAEYHHVFGALWVEIDAHGKWFVRQLNADDDGVVFDVDKAWGPTWDRPITEFGRPFVNLGDVHIEKSNDRQMTCALDLIQQVDPEAVFIHDLFDMESRNHHNLLDPHFLVKNIGREVERDVKKAAAWLQAMTRAFPNTTFYVIRSNHDQALERWVKFGSKFVDPVNMRYWHQLNLYALTSIEAPVKYDIFRFALECAVPELTKLSSDGRIKWITEDQSVILRGIEFGMHGHLGPNGSRPSPKSFRQMGRRANTGHTHSAGIIDGVWTAGVLGDLDMGYNSGPSSWSCSHILTYPNGKRAIVTQAGNNWRA